MIEYMYLEVKKLEDSRAELDKLTNYEGWVVVCCIGKRNNILLLNRSIEYPEPVQAVPTKTRKGVKGQRFPNAVYK